jgi:cytochrome c556
MTMMRKKAWIAVSIASAAVLAASFPVASSGAPSAQATVDLRRANFKKMGGAMKVLKDQIASGSPSKPATVAAAQTINSIARGQAALFPAGTGPGAGVKTDALPAIWSQKPVFDAQMNKLVGESAKLIAAANTGNTAALTAQFKATGGVCGECHKQFRHDDD